MADDLPPLSQSSARALMLAAQGLDRRPARRPGRQDVLEVVRRMGALQIDTINVVARSPYLVLWSRLGDYQPRWLDELLSEGALFEYWSHEACLLPIEDYRLYRHQMLDPGAMRWKYSHAYLQKYGDEARQLRERIRDLGPVRSSDFQRREGAASGWWEWKPEKRILEYLFTAGELMVARRDRFQRIYDLRERVLPTWTDDDLPTREEAQRGLILRAVRALGVTRARWVADYFRQSKKETPARVRGLADEGALLQVPVEGWDEPGYVHPDRAELARAAAAGEVKPRLTTLLSPFDPLVWDRARALDMFGFDYRLECYTPAPKRRFGYFVLPILRKGALVGRLDAKAHRKQGVFEVRALYLEAGVRTSDLLVRDVARTLQKCAAWHGTPQVVVRGSEPAEVAGRVEAVCRETDRSG